MKSILVTGIAGDIGRGILKCLKDCRAGYQIIGSDLDPYIGYLRLVDNFYVAPRATESAHYKKFLEGIIKKHTITDIFPASEQEIAFFDQNRAWSNTLGLNVYINTSEILRVFSDKWLTYEFLTKQGVACPKSVLWSMPMAMKFPVIVKPRVSAGGRSVVKVSNQEQLDAWRVLMPNAVIQQYLPAAKHEYTIGVFSDGKEVRVIAFRRELGFSGVSKLVECVDDKEVVKLGHQIAKSCALVGAINIQTRKEKDIHHVFEINPRFSSTVYFRHIFGFQDVCWWFNLMKQKPMGQNYQVKHGVAIRQLTETFFGLK